MRKAPKFRRAFQPIDEVKQEPESPPPEKGTTLLRYVIFKVVILVFLLLQITLSTMAALLLHLRVVSLSCVLSIHVISIIFSP